MGINYGMESGTITQLSTLIRYKTNVSVRRCLANDSPEGNLVIFGRELITYTKFSSEQIAPSFVVTCATDQKSPKIGEQVCPEVLPTH